MTANTGLVVKCPICKKDTPWSNNSFRPFCSKSCKIIDLGEWASNRYVVPDRAATLEEIEQEKKEED